MVGTLAAGGGVGGVGAVEDAGIVTGCIVAVLAPEASTSGDFFLYTSK